MIAAGLMGSALAAYLLLCFLAALLLWKGSFHAPGAFFVIVLLVPYIGFTALLFVEWTMRRRIERGISDELMSIGQGAAPNSAGSGEESDPSGVIPLEEALLINDTKTRREIIQSILRRDPSQFVHLLKIARLNDDTEVVHYATTTIMEIQRNYEVSLQQLDKELLRSRDDAEANRESVDLIDHYLASGLLEGYPKERMRQRFGSALERQAAGSSDRMTLLKLAENKAALGDVDGAEAEVDRVLQRWPADEEAWLLGLRIAAESHDPPRLKAWLGRMQISPVRWTASGKETLLFWTERDVHLPGDTTRESERES